jgi:hypothetical protein
MRITEEIRGDCGETCRRISGKGAPICCACAGEVYPFSRTLPLLTGTDLAGFWHDDQGWAMRRVI